MTPEQLARCSQINWDNAGRRDVEFLKDLALAEAKRADEAERLSRDEANNRSWWRDKYEKCHDERDAAIRERDEARKEASVARVVGGSAQTHWREVFEELQKTRAHNAAMREAIDYTLKEAHVDDRSHDRLTAAFQSDAGAAVLEELSLLRQLADNRRQRRALEPKHSHQDHECEECEILAALAKLRERGIPL